MAAERLERSTYGLWDRRSNQLSYAALEGIALKSLPDGFSATEWKGPAVG